MQDELDIWEEEMDFTLREIAGVVYLIPHPDNALLSISLRDIRESESRSDLVVDAFLQCYITMTILWMIYGGKNNNPKRVMFLQIKDIIDTLNERFLTAGAADAMQTDAMQIEESLEINFTQIANLWNAMQTHDEQRRKTRRGAVLKACGLLERQKLIYILDEKREIRPTKRLDDLMIGYYLHEERISAIHKLFNTIKEPGHA